MATLITGILLAVAASTSGSAPPSTCDKPAAASRPAAKADTCYAPLTYRAATWYGSTFWTGPDWTRVGKDWQHPGQNTPSVRRFDAPRDGRVTITGRVFKLHLDGDGICASIRHNQRELWRAAIGGKDGTGLEPKLTLDVKKGESLRFIVDKGRTIACDTTGWDPLVTYADGQRFQASAGFAAQKQGAGGWFYEMLGVPPAPAAAEAVAVSKDLGRELARIGPRMIPGTEPGMLPLILEAWWREDKLADTVAAYRAAAADHLAHARRLAAELNMALPVELERAAGAAPQDLPQWRTHYLTVRLPKRKLALANPLLSFGPLLACKRVPPSWSHVVAQYYGWRQRPGGGLFVIEKPGYSLAARNILGRQLPPGSVLEPRLSYDGRRILFAFVACSAEVPQPASLPVNEQGTAQRYFHLYEVNVDGSGLRQLTDAPYDDMMGEYLPDGRIVFCSTRRKGYARCFGPEYSYRWHTYTLHSMNADGRDIRTLSYNDVSEWFPTVSPAGHILYARWDYIDRDAVTHQNLWSMRPDGTNPEAVWGNAAPKPHCVLQARPVPNSPKIVFIASAHHSITGGPVCLLDPTVDANRLEAVTRVTPLAFPEAEGQLAQWYQSPWPLSEKYFLVAYSPYKLRFQGEHQSDPNPDNALGIYLLDTAGNRELLYRDPEIGTTTPTPLAPRVCPPLVPSELPAGAPPAGRMVVSDIYQGLGGVPRDAVKQLRIVQVFPKSTWLANLPRMGVAGEENGRAILGTVPVEADGSACFDLPAGKPVLFQALDEQGMALQTMRSLTYVQPGEQTSCVGCHEGRMSAPPSQTGSLAALRHGPVRIEPGELGGRPFGYAEVVQPIWDSRCVRCHGGEKLEGGCDLRGTPERGFSRSYWALCGNPPRPTSRPLASMPAPAPAAGPLVPRFAERNQIQATQPGGACGARGSRLMKLLLARHAGVELSATEIGRIAAWIDLNAIFYGVYEAEPQARQLAGQRVAMPPVQ